VKITEGVAHTAFFPNYFIAANGTKRIIVSYFKPHRGFGTSGKVVFHKTIKRRT
jgi:hypothetical protein